MNSSFTIFILAALWLPCPVSTSTSVHITVLSQERFVNQGHHPENNRRVRFKLINRSRMPIIVYGFKDGDDFDPTGYLMILNKETARWEYPNPDNKPAEWDEVSSDFKSKVTLRPNESIKFLAEMSGLEVGSQFRRTIYVSRNENGKLCEVRGTPFVLR
jgi:hypothetical protein